jgi:hypothetical protein
LKKFQFLGAPTISQGSLTSVSLNTWRTSPGPTSTPPYFGTVDDPQQLHWFLTSVGGYTENRWLY